MSKEAMKLALEALEYIDLTDNDRDFLHPHECYMIDEAITALRKALAEQPAQQCKWPICQSEEYQQVLAEQIKRELVGEQPAQQEPVGALILGGVVDTSDGPEYEEWDIEWNHKAIESLQERLVTHNPVTLNIYTSPPAQQQQKPVTDKENEKFRRDVSNFAGADPEANKYALEEFLKNRTSPPAQRTWVGLTPEEVQAAVYDENGCVVDYEDYASAIEAKLKEKNA